MRTDPPAPPSRPTAASLRRLLLLARPEWRQLALATVFLVIASGMGLVYPQGLRWMLDEAVGQGRAEVINRTALALVLVALLQGLAMAGRYSLFSISGERVVTRLREQLYGALLRQEIAFFDERRTGELTNRLASDTTVLQNAVSANISMVLRNAAQVVGGLIFLFYTSPTLTLLMLAVVPPIAVGAVINGRRVRKLSRDVQDALAASNEVAEESLAGIRTVRSFAAEQSEAERYTSAVRRSFELARKRVNTGSVFMGTATFLGFSAVTVVLWYGTKLLREGTLTPGALFSFLIYTVMMAASLGAMAELWADFMRAAGAAERVFDLLERVPTIVSEGGERPATLQGKVELSKVVFAYPTRKDVRVLDGIDLTVAPGEIVALVGPSGAGKSTIAALLARFYDPVSGQLKVDGRDLTTLDPKWLRQHVGTVAQEPILFSTTIAENIRYARPEASEPEVVAAARAANADTFIRGFPDGYQTKVGERGVQLSGGQKQRIAIARAVLKNPRILILDEATSALDAESEHLVKEALDRLMVGRTTLVIAHRLSTVVDAHRVVVLDGGKVVQSGPHKQLIREPGLYRKLVERQFVAA